MTIETKQIIWEDEHVGIFLELPDIELAKIRYRQKVTERSTERTYL
uniref:Uncharacterized protein n=1 Tax=Brassica oleracea TaxID=3712 RepID=A0A3P6DQJ6_BRAOL|nr:unnamed protein product [Brassica oleracea]